MYKDKDKQREANRKAQAKFKAKGITEGIVRQGITGIILEGITDEEFRDAMPKRGKDIKCFDDLPADVQETINKMSVVDGKTDDTVKANRTAIAINYQHLFPWRYYSTGVA